MEPLTIAIAFSLVALSAWGIVDARRQKSRHDAWMLRLDDVSDAFDEGRRQ